MKIDSSVYLEFLVDNGNFKLALSKQKAPLGAKLYEGGCNFKVFSPAAKEVYLCLFNEYEEEIQRIQLKERVGPYWCGFVEGVQKGQYYGYRVVGQNDPMSGNVFDISKLLIDPYARLLNRPQEWNYEIYKGDSQKMISKCVVTDDSFDWEGVEKPHLSDSDYIIYETHVRGYTMLNPDVPAHLRGTYLGMCEPAVIKHLKDIGITAVQFMPVHAHMDESRLVDLKLCNYWGYNSISFFAPEPRYASDPLNAINEFKTMVKTLHRNGIAVILDVVYNHTAEGGFGGPSISFRGFENKNFYQYEKDQHGNKIYNHYCNHTGCGNSVNVDDPNVLKLVIDSLRYWYKEMQVDGFRFDLATTLAREEAANGYNVFSAFFKTIHQDEILEDALLIAEPWDVGGFGYRVGQFPRDWKELNDRYRDTIRSFWRGDEGKMADFATRLLGSRDFYPKTLRSIHSSVNFITYHDGFTLHDLVSYNYRHNEANAENNSDGHSNNLSYNYGEEGPTANVKINFIREQQKRNMLATLMLSQGIPHFVAGDEMGRTQLGNNNAYCQDNRISWVNWELSDEDRDLAKFTGLLNRIRLESTVFRELKLHDDRYFGTLPVEHEVAWYHADGHELTESDWNNPNSKLFTLDIGDLNGTGERWLVLFNASSYDIGYHLPRPGKGMKWNARLDTSEPDGVPFELTSQSKDLLGLTKAHSVKIINQIVDPNPAKKPSYVHRPGTKIRMGINGFGRIGRSVLRAALLRDDVEIVGINDPLAGDAHGNVTQQGVEYLAYLLKYDSTHGILYADVEVYNNKIILNGRPIRITAQKDPAKLCWYEIGVSVVIEATGLFLSTSKACAHVDAGAYKVVITGPVKDETPMFVMGVNENTYQGDDVVSNASCTTNALAPIVKIIQDHYGIESALMTTVHSYTASQKTVDGPSAKDWRGGRGAAQNIIPSTTGAAKAVGKVVPELDGKITGISMRVPTADVSLVDVTINLSTAADYEQICETIRKEAEGAYKGIVAYVDDAVVSSDILGGTAISYFDAQAGLSVNDKLVKLVAWYDNEVGYSNKVLDLAKHVILHP